MITIGERIAERRKATGLTQISLADLLDVSTAFISQIESGNRNPSHDLLLRIARELDTTVDYIISGRAEVKVARLTYAVEKRLRFIDFLLQQYGAVSRSALTDYFGISVPQASLDIKKYIELAPSNIEYDKSDKLYRSTKQFSRIWA